MALDCHAYGIHFANGLIVARSHEDLCFKKIGGRTLLDQYGATNKAETLAVATEMFFEKPSRLRQKRKALLRCWSSPSTSIR